MNDKPKPRGRNGGRKPSPVPLFYKKLRATPERQAKFIAMMTGDAAKDFDMIFTALRSHQTILNYSKPTAFDKAMSALQPEIKHKAKS